MNILLISSRSDMGGGPRHVHDILKGLKNNPDLNIFVSTPIDPPFGNFYKENAKGFFPIKHRHFSLLRLLALISWAKKNKIQIIHSHGRGAGLYSRLMKFFGFKIVHSFHGIHSPQNRIDYFKAFIDKILILLTDSLVFIGQDEKLQFENIYNQNNAVKYLIPNGIDCASFKAQTTQVPPRSENQVILGVLARLDQHKGIPFLVKAMEHLESHYHLRIAGSGPDEGEITNLIQSLSLENRVTLVGQVEEPAYFLNNIDILVSNSKSEGMPYSVIEALCLEKKLLLSNVPGHQQFENNAILFQKDDLSSFLMKISSLKDMSPKPYLWDLNQMCDKLVRDVYVK